MDSIIKISFDDNGALAIEAVKEMKEIGIEVPTIRAAPPTEIVAVLSSVGAFAGLYQIIVELLKRNKDRVVTIKRKGLEVSFTNISLPEMERLLEEFAPELKSRKDKNRH